MNMIFWQCNTATFGGMEKKANSCAVRKCLAWL